MEVVEAATAAEGGLELQNTSQKVTKQYTQSSTGIIILR